MSLPKWTNDRPQSLKIGEQTIVIPPSTGVMPSLLAVQTHPKYWKDPLIWKPSRWISSSAAPTSDLATRLQAEVVFTPEKCAYFPLTRLARFSIVSFLFSFSVVARSFYKQQNNDTIS